MHKQGDMIYCDCGNEGWLDMEDPDAPGKPMQLAGPNWAEDLYGGSGYVSSPEDFEYDPEDEY